jgi:hypothetical protein
MIGQGGKSSVIATQKVADVVTATAQLGPGLSPLGDLTDGLLGGEQTASSLRQALSDNEYFSFSLAPQVGKSLTITKLEIRPVSHGPRRTFVVFSSLRGFTAGQQVGTFTGEQAIQDTLRSLALSNHTNLTTPIEFRVYVFGGDNIYESVGVGNRLGMPGTYDLAVYGASAPASGNARLAANEPKAQLVTLYPNPASQEFIVSGLDTESMVEIVSIDGQVLKRQDSVTDHSRIDISEFKVGLYLVRINNRLQGMIYRKVIKQ